MLQLMIPAGEQYDEVKQEFIRTNGCTLQLEHSLVSLSKWESKWCKPFFVKDPKTIEETRDYIRCMTITQNVDPNVYLLLSNKHIEQVNKYIEAPMTATTFSSMKRGRISREIITSELIYYWMIALNIPFECQKWHLNRLLTLIRVCDIKSQPEKKMGMRNIMSRNSALNAARRKSLNSKG